MKTRFPIALGLLLLGGWLGARAGDLLDRILVVVNNQVILQSDLQQAVRYEALLNGQPLDQVTAAGRHDTLERLIDQTLILQQMRQTEIAPPDPAEVAAQVQKIRDQVLGHAGGADWATLLARYDLTEQEFEFRAGQQYTLTRFLDQRFRPMVRVDPATVQEYYQNKFLPQMRQAGAKRAPPLREVGPKIEEALTQEQIDQLLVAWLHTLRGQSDIRLHPATVAPSQQGVVVP